MPREFCAPFFVWDAMDQPPDHHSQHSRLFGVQHVDSSSSKDMTKAEGLSESDDDTEVKMLLDDDEDESSFCITYSNDVDVDWNQVSENEFHRTGSDCPSFYGDDNDEEEDFSDENSEFESSESAISIHTPPVEFQQDLVFAGCARKVSPEPFKVPIEFPSAPDLMDVQRQVQCSLKKLACSMRRTEETRRIIKRQRRLPDETDESLSSIGMMNESFGGLCNYDETRRKVYDMIQLGVASTY